MTKHPVIARELAAYHNAQINNTIADANFVLEQSVRLYDRAMGDATVEVDVIETVRNDDGTTCKRARTIERRDYNPAIARQALELIGRHTSIQAFQDNVEHTHTHRLEQALARRSKLVEAAADARIIEGTSEVIIENTTRPAGAEDKRGSISPEVNSNAPNAPTETRAGSRGAPAI
jgi:hypothetical protein